jgi:hypothetical protein
VYEVFNGTLEFFSRFGVSTVPITSTSLTNKYVDFSTGLGVTSYPSPNQTAANIALGTYAQIAGQYTPLFFPGYFSWPLPPNIPEDLTMPFGQFVQKYSIQAALPTIWTFVNALGDVLNSPTLFVMQLFGAVQINSLATGGFVVPVSHNNSQLYGAIASSLGSNVLYSSTVSASQRDSSGIKLIVNTPAGKKLVKAKKLLVTAAPTVDNLSKLDLDATETNIFGKWSFRSDYVGVISHTGLPDGLDIINAVPDGSAGVDNFPTPPFVTDFAFTGVPGLYRTTVIGDPDMNEHNAKIMVRNALNAVGKAGTFDTKHLNFEAFADHTPLSLRVSAADLSSGFYSQLYSLLGYRNTFYTGSAWCSDYSSVVWLFTEIILPQIVATL